MTARLVSITEGRKLDPGGKFYRDYCEAYGVVMCDPEPEPDDEGSSERARRRERNEE